LLLNHSVIGDVYEVMPSVPLPYKHQLDHFPVCSERTILESDK
jgi:hypothetical protein